MPARGRYSRGEKNNTNPWTHPRTDPPNDPPILYYSSTAVRCTWSSSKAQYTAEKFTNNTHEPTMYVHQYNSSTRTYSTRTYSSAAEKYKNKKQTGGFELTYSRKKNKKNAKKQIQGHLN